MYSDLKHKLGKFQYHTKGRHNCEIIYLGEVGGNY